MRTLSLVCAAALLACGGSHSSGPVEVTGVWILETINGHALPTNANGSETVINGQLNLEPNTQFTDTYHYSLGNTGTRTSTTIGIWSQSGRTLTFSSNGSYTGSVVAGRLGVTKLGGEIWLYTR
jgi:hypothetical protein